MLNLMVADDLEQMRISEKLFKENKVLDAHAANAAPSDDETQLFQDRDWRWD
ncbi:hypothetical protein [Paenibacillus periandrae]|uniref:hypothetical protein n=1 Tax=Paenibacillus periandrae TaxID=1761741 RepID=UPI001F08FBA5|nr:hypothetical protein [Paenibacillus periandrae]